MTDIHIPPEALEAGARAIHDMRYGTHLYSADDIARAAFLAMVKAWPGMEVKSTFWPNDAGVWIVPRHALSLPLPPQPALGEPEHE